MTSLYWCHLKWHETLLQTSTNTLRSTQGIRTQVHAQLPGIIIPVLIKALFEYNGDGHIRAQWYDCYAIQGSVMSPRLILSLEALGRMDIAKASMPVREMNSSMVSCLAACMRRKSWQEDGRIITIPSDHTLPWAGNRLLPKLWSLVLLARR